MNRIKKICIVFFIIFIFSGCVKYDVSMDIKSDKSVKVSAIYYVHNTFIDKSHFDIKKELYENRNIEAQLVNDDKYTGIMLTKEYDNIDDISTDKDIDITISDLINPEFDDKILFKVEEGFLKNKYTANYKYNTNIDNVLAKEYIDIFKTDESIDINDTADLEEKLNILSKDKTFTYKVSLPVESFSSNANEKTNSNKTLYWDIKPNDIATINFSFELKNKTNYIIFYGGIIVMSIVFVILLIFLIFKLRSKIKYKNNSKYPIYTDYDPDIEDMVFNTVSSENLNINTNIIDEKHDSNNQNNNE